MKLYDCVKAYIALSELMTRKYKSSVSYSLYKVKSEIESDYRYFSERESELVEKYGKKDNFGKIALDENGKFEFISPEAKEAFDKERAELFDTEINEITPIKCSLPDEIEGRYIEALSPFAEFEI